ncbi:ABC transporter ATP-binding protein [Parasporobacterium paucivorans]|uniref:Iron complex transport system ATP-binding protein n=1 Tax=Parasporobacterium paucivorans DSM 15970 TaxID=1122934 RepID=A0A1M6EKI6_9FIRM|nr:ABC transporter ATP-binding protein [Parasporobacterium paucivorans]SHI85997.1 iron complex transport system ATP-binding protein [Parasporobacterium paucivorans DSM 15970]
MLLKVKDLCCGYDGVPVVENLNFEMNEGELWCILGANGIGKSTLFKTLLGLLKPVSGQVLVQDKPLEKWSRKDLAKVTSYVPQSHTPPFPFKAFEIIVMGRHPYQNGIGAVREEDIRAVQDALRLLDIEHLAEKNYTQISGGERQMVLMARAIVQGSSLMILDEPVSNLDFGNHAKVISYIRKLVSMGKTVVMTTHHPDHAFIPESRVLIMENRSRMRVGIGTDIVTEECVHEMYGVDNKILLDVQDNRQTCIPLY